MADLAWELPQWDPKEPPGWIVWVAGRFGDGKTDIHSEWKRWRAEQRAGFEEDERSVTAAELEQR
jgi:hypothetical protein